MGWLGHLTIFGYRVCLDCQIGFFFSCFDHKEAVISGWVGSREKEEVFHTGHYLQKIQMLLLSLLDMLKAIEGLHEANFPGSL